MVAAYATPRLARWAVPSATTTIALAGWFALQTRGLGDPNLIEAFTVAFIASLLGEAIVAGADALEAISTKSRAFNAVTAFVRQLYDASLGRVVARLRALYVRTYDATLGKIHLGLSRQFVVMAFIFAVVWALGLWLLFNKITNTDKPTAQIAALAGIAATAGWLFSSWVAARNTQRQNTITLLLNMRHSDVFSRHFNNAYFASQHAETLNDWKGCREADLQSKWPRENADCHPTSAPQSALTVRSVYQSVMYVLNYYEFIAAGVRNGALDASIVRNTISPHIRTYAGAFKHWVEEERNAQQSRASHENLDWYCKKFPARKKIAPKPASPPASGLGTQPTNRLALHSTA